MSHLHEFAREQVNLRLCVFCLCVFCFAETVVKVEDDDLFDVMVEFALELPGRVLEVDLVQTHWWPVKGEEFYLGVYIFDIFIYIFMYVLSRLGVCSKWMSVCVSLTLSLSCSLSLYIYIHMSTCI